MNVTLVWPAATVMPGGTELRALHEGLVPGLSAEDDELGWRQSLKQLAAYVERKRPGRTLTCNLSVDDRAFCL